MSPSPTRRLARIALVLLALAPLAQPAGAQGSGSTGGAGLLTERQFSQADQGIRIEGSVQAVENVVYGTGRPTITRGDVSITADRIRVDQITQEVEAEGDVVYIAPETEIRASRGIYSFRQNQGVAWDVEGTKDPIFFRSSGDEEEEGPSFRRISEDEALFRNAQWTTSGFPVPTYYVAAKEVIIIPNDRIFMKHAVLHVRGVPVFYWPVYTRAFDEQNPWTIEAGFRSRYGAYLTLGYTFQHEARVPEWDNPSEYRTRSRGNLKLKSDLFTTGTIGVGTEYKYEFGFRRHIGSLQMYGVRDQVRDVPDDDEKERYIYRHRHNSVFGNTLWQLNADWMSDPDIYEDLVDPMDDVDRGRVPERRLRAAAVYLKEDWLARLSAEVKDRVALDEYQDYAEPLGDNLNWDPDPDFTVDEDDNDDFDGIANDRYGRVSENLNGRVATRLLPFLRTPLHWQARGNAFSSLDAGFNELDSDDDARYNGGDFYTSLTHRAKFDEAGRFTWLNTVGVGAGNYSRDTDDLVEDGLGGAVGGVTFPDDDRVIVSNGSRELDYGEVDPTHLWADYTSRLNARLSENTSAFARYRIREGTSDSVGEFWERTGRLEAFEDTYDFPTDSHWVDGELRYSPLYPKLDMYLTGGYNLDQREDYTANEKLYYVGPGTDWQSDSGEWLGNAEVLFQGRQARDQRDPDNYEFEEISGVTSMKYMPVHQRYWAGLEVNGNVPLNNDPKDDVNARRRRFDENRSDVGIRPTIGKQFGPKYAVELSAEWSTRLDKIREAGVTVQRDLYDADLFVFAGMKQNTFNDRDDQDDTNDRDPDTDSEMDVRVGIRFKTPNEKSGLSAVSMKTMRDKEREASFAE